MFQGRKSLVAAIVAATFLATGFVSLPADGSDAWTLFTAEPGAAGQAEAGSETAADTFQALEKKFADLAASVEKLEAAEEKRSAKKFPTLDLEGRIHFDSVHFLDDSPGIAQFEGGDDPENRYYFRRIRLGIEGQLNETTVYTYQIDFNEPNDPQYKDVYIGFTDLPILQTLLIGNQKRPLGLDHLNSSNANIFMERPTVVDSFNNDARRIGICSYGVSDDEVYNWRFGGFLLRNTRDDGSVVLDSEQWSLNGRLASSPWYDETSGGRGYFHWAIAGMLAWPDGEAGSANEARFSTRPEIRTDASWLDTGRIAGATDYQVLACESIVNLGPLQIVGEYMANWLNRNNLSGLPNGGDDLFFHGGYVYVAYTLTGEHIPLNRREGRIGQLKPFENFFLVNRCGGDHGWGWGAWQLALRYSHMDLTDGGPAATGGVTGGVENNLTGAVVWYMNANTSLQFNAIYGDIDERGPVGGFSDGHFTAIGTRLRVFW